MADGTAIEWTDATVNAVNGCTVVSPGCKHCYAMRLAGTRMRTHPTRAGLTVDTKAGPVWNGDVRLNEAALQQPLRWKRPRRIFWNAHGDLFHPSVPDEWIDRCFDVMEATRHHIHQVLTKRPERMAAYLSARWALPSAINAFYGLDPEVRLFAQHPSIWLGVSVEDQQRADERIPHLLATPAAMRFLSIEPLLGPVQIAEYLPNPLWNAIPSWKAPEIDWVIVGGESGPGARPMHPNWVRSLRDECATAGVPFFFKQWGNWRPAIEGDSFDTSKGRAQRNPAFLIAYDGAVHCFMRNAADRDPVVVHVGKKAAGRLLDGVEHSAMPT